MKLLNLVRSNSSPSLVTNNRGEKKTHENNSLSQVIKAVNTVKNSVMPIEVKVLNSWVNKDTRPACKYSPVVVSKDHKYVDTMKKVEENRINISRKLASSGKCGSSWLSFIRDKNDIEGRYHKNNTPAIVISGGNAKKLANEMMCDYSLAFHPKNMRGEPVYIMVHKEDYKTYYSELSALMNQNHNLHLVGWDGGKLTGFGAARAAALSFADSLPYKPDRILMMDQDVVQTEGTRHTKPEVKSKINRIHNDEKRPIAGYGVGYPTRQEVPSPFSKGEAPTVADFNSPTQQFVSIASPFRGRLSDGIYPAYMVTGGEDMLMGLDLKLIENEHNNSILNERIVKKELKGSTDSPNKYWNENRIETLKELFESEKNTMFLFEGNSVTLDGLMQLFVDKGWVSSHPSPESYNTASCIIERVILRRKKLVNNETISDNTIFNRL
ncbi:hypothetical protein ACP6H1_20990 [Vibrio harveyi]|uniref:hypothetical protein n=1 Tax=Vibrio harveyi TaxID=669 RepID=UPI002853B136|nr:hypothetical protein [Vibrio harveyi]ELC3160025.1 hypothetical protein [Vibrio harveyi]